MSDPIIEKAVEDQLSPKPDDPDKPTTLVVWAEIDWLLSVAQTGYSETTGETRQEYLRVRRTNITMERARVFDAGAFKRAVGRIEGYVYTWASQQYALLKYGNALSDVLAGISNLSRCSTSPFEFDKALAGHRSGAPL